MRSNDHIIKRKQTGQYIIVDNFIRLVFIEVFALLLVHVQTGRRDLLFLQAFDQVVGVDQLARPVLMIITPSFILSMESLSIIYFVWSVSGQCKEMMSDSRYSSSNET